MAGFSVFIAQKKAEKHIDIRKLRKSPKTII